MDLILAPLAKPELSESEWRVLKSIAGAAIPGLKPTQAHKKAFEEVLTSKQPLLVTRFRLALSILSLPGVSSVLTMSPHMIADMPPADVEQVLIHWTKSPLALNRQLAFGFISLSLYVFYHTNEAFWKLADEVNVHPDLLRLQQNAADMWVLPKVSIPQPLTATSRPIISTDVAIVGSGCSAMVAAYRLAQAGYRVLILEKAYHLNALTSPDRNIMRDKECYESSGAVLSEDSSMFVVAGSTVGGGGAVNWSCSLRTPEPIRDEWIERGAPLYGEREYDDAMDAVERIMHVTDDVGHPHSFTNQLILDSSRKLGYPARATGQNTGKHVPNSAFVEFGSRGGADQGGIAEWFRYAVANGTEILQRAHVTAIRHQNGHASGLDVELPEGQKLIVNCKRVVVAAGSLQTPALLRRSGFKNKHIGLGLKLHPVTVVFGEFDEKVNKTTDPIMTAVSLQVDNLDGHYHGPKIEAMHHRPHLLMAFLPWRNGQDWQRMADAYPHLAAVLVITRDKTSGSITLDRTGNPSLNYTPNAYDLQALKTGSLNGANMLYIGGAKRIILSSTKFPDFVSTKPKEQRSIWDADYREWFTQVEKGEAFATFDTHTGSAHQMASCRMSNKGAKYAPVDAKGHLYECYNVHVIDTSVFPSASGVNPMISCMSTAYVLSRHLIDDLRKAQTKL